MLADERHLGFALRVALENIGCASIFAADAGKISFSGEKGQFRHRIVLAVERPERCLVPDGCGGDEGIWDFQVVAPGVFAQELSSQPAGFVIRCDADKGTKEARDKLVLARECARPDFRGSNGRVQNYRAGEDER
jgi:hypothetical protein